VQLLSAIALHIAVLSFAGFDAAQRFSAYVLSFQSHHEFLWPGMVVVLLLYAALGWAALGCGRYRGTLALLLGAHVVFAFVSFDNALFGDFTGVMSVIGDQRYAFASMVLTGLIFIGCASASAGWRKVVCAAVACYLLAVGAWNYRAGTAPFADGPAWAPQMAEWRKNPQMVLSVWPAEWYMRLPPRK
jgi:hypothetical protein